MKTWTARGAAALAATAIAIGGAACEPAPPLPSASIADSTVVEGTGGVSNLWFSLKLSAPSTQVVRLAWRALNGTAVAPGDFAASQGTVEFTPGTTAAALDPPRLPPPARLQRVRRGPRGRRSRRRRRLGLHRRR